MRYLYLGLLVIAIVSNFIFILNAIWRIARLYKKKVLLIRDQ